MPAVLINGFGAVARHRWLFLAGALVLAVAAGLVVQSDRLNMFVVLFGLMLPLLALSGLATLRYRSHALLVRPEPRAFATEANVGAMLMAASFFILAGCLVVEDLTDIVAREEFWALNVTTAVLVLLAAGLHGYGAWGPFGVRLSPAGVHDRSLLGSLFVPWEAFAPGCPAVPANGNRNGLILYSARPELVRRRGVRVGFPFAPTGIDADFLAHVIHRYVAGPEHRPAIGTEAELHRLTTRVAA
jgi:hypothetical protein